MSLTDRNGEKARLRLPNIEEIPALDPTFRPGRHLLQMPTQPYIRGVPTGA